MQRPLVVPVLLCLSLFGCKKTQRLAGAVDAATPALASPEPIRPSTDAGQRASQEDAATPPAPPLPIASEDLSLVAVGKGWGAKILWLKVLGSRVWLSGKNLDAYADGDGPLTKGPDLLKGLPYTFGVHALDVAGIYPHLYALRTKNVETRTESQEAAAFVLREGAWTPSKKLPRTDYPHAFVGWGDGAILMWSQIELNGGPFWDGREEGTTLSYVAPDGSVGPANVKVERSFLAWSASSDGTTLSLLGTRGHHNDDGTPEKGLYASRGTAKDGMKTILLSAASTPGMETYAASVVELGDRAYVAPPPSLTITEAWKPEPSSVFTIADGKSTTITALPGGGEECLVQGMAMVDSSIYVIRMCWSLDATELVRIGEGSKREKIKLPMIAKKADGSFRVAEATDKASFRCDPKKLHVRPPSDLWIEADCGKGIPAIFRRGKAQDVVTLP